MAADDFHFVMEAFGDAVVAREVPHTGDLYHTSCSFRARATTSMPSEESTPVMRPLAPPTADAKGKVSRGVTNGVEHERAFDVAR